MPRSPGIRPVNRFCGLPLRRRIPGCARLGTYFQTILMASADPPTGRLSAPKVIDAQLSFPECTMPDPTLEHSDARLLSGHASASVGGFDAAFGPPRAKSHHFVGLLARAYAPQVRSS